MSQQARSPYRYQNKIIETYKLYHWVFQIDAQSLLDGKQALNKGMMESQGLLMEHMKEVMRTFMSLNKKKTERAHLGTQLVR